MGQLEEEIEEASRGRKVSTLHPDEAEFERHRRETEESFKKVNADRANHNKSKPKP